MNTSPRKTTRRAPAAAPAPAENTAVDLKSKPGSSAPALPHERDESVGMTGGLPSGTVQQGARDLKHGLEDTSRAPEADRAYKKLKK
jgi:hypothetical protein